CRCCLGESSRACPQSRWSGSSEAPCTSVCSVCSPNPSVFKIRPPSFVEYTTVATPALVRTSTCSPGTSDGKKMCFPQPARCASSGIASSYSGTSLQLQQPLCSAVTCVQVRQFFSGTTASVCWWQRKRWGHILQIQ